jgi:hypothetical protein
MIAYIITIHIIFTQKPNSKHSQVYNNKKNWNWKIFLIIIILLLILYCIHNNNQRNLIIRVVNIESVTGNSVQCVIIIFTKLNKKKIKYL